MKLLAAVSIFLITLLVSCGGDSEGPSNPTAAATTTQGASPTTAATTQANPTAAATGLNSLSLVYLDRSKGQGAELYVAAFDGGSPKLVATIANPTRPLDVRGKTLAVTGNDLLTFYDLTNGQQRNLKVTGTVSDGRFLDDSTFVYTTTGGCSGMSKVMRYSLASNENRELVSLTGNLAIGGIDADSSSVAIVPRGCDPAVQSISIYNVTDGKELQKLATPGCGYADVSIAQKKALLSWMSCTATEAGTQATIYDFSTVNLNKKDIIGPSGGINSQPILLRPGSNEAVFATKSAGGNGPGSVTGTGVWQADLSSLSVGVLVPGQGLEQTPLFWTDDGRYLVVQSVEAQGRCTYSYADATNKQAKPINAAITFCGVNGEVVGWTALK